MAIDPNLEGPQFVQFFVPVIDALKSLGGSGRPAEVRNIITERFKIPEEIQNEQLKNGTKRLDNQIAWARFYLVKADYIDSSQRGVWALTERGLKSNIDHAKALELFKTVQAGMTSNDEEKPIPSESSDENSEDAAAIDDTPEQLNYRQEVLQILQALPPSGFERFCQRLLRESGFEDVEVTGKSNDGGIDGIGILAVNLLVSFKVLFQCKRYKNVVTPREIRDFRGAMQGRADKGIFLTTGTFTKEAKNEALRDGVTPIELVDGEKLVTMLETLEIGLRPVRSYQVDHKFFEVFRD